MAGESGFKIWVHASQEKRAQRTAQRDNLEIHDARKKLETRDKIEREQFLKIYGLDILHQESKADLIIDTSQLTPEEVLSIVLEKINQ